MADLQARWEGTVPDLRAPSPFGVLDGRRDFRGAPLASLRGLPGRPIRLGALDLTGATLEKGSRWARVRGEGLCLEGADLRDLTQSGCSFSGCSFDRADLSHAHLGNGSAYRSCTFRRAKLRRAGFGKARFEDCVFEDTSFVGSDIVDAGVFAGSRFAGAMQGLVLDGGSLRCDLSGVESVDVGLTQGVDLSACVPPRDTGRVRMVLDGDRLWRDVERLRAEAPALADQLAIFEQTYRSSGQLHQLFDRVLVREVAPDAAEGLWKMMG